MVFAAVWRCQLSHRHSFPRIPVSGPVWPWGGGQRKAGNTWDARSQPRSQQSVHPSVHTSVYTRPATEGAAVTRDLVSALRVGSPPALLLAST